MADDINQTPVQEPPPVKSRHKKQNTKTPETPTPETSTYEERSKFFLDELFRKCKDENVKVAVVYLIDPKLAKPIIYATGHIYDQTTVACDLARLLKQQLMNSDDLTV